MKYDRILVVGATGDVGLGIVSAALASGRSVVAAGRSVEKLGELAAEQASDRIAIAVGDLSSEAGAAALWDEAAARFGSIDAVVVAVNAPNRLQPLIEMNIEDLSRIAEANLFTHFIAAKTFLPRLPDDGIFIGIGGGTADFIVPRMTPVSMMQAALRMMYRGFARERKDGARLRELMIVSMVNGSPNGLPRLRSGAMSARSSTGRTNFPGRSLRWPGANRLAVPNKRHERRELNDAKLPAMPHMRGRQPRDQPEGTSGLPTSIAFTRPGSWCNRPK